MLKDVTIRAVFKKSSKKKKSYPIRDLSGNLVAHDPALAKEDDFWWLFHTGKGLQVKYSSDGYTWAQGLPIFEKPLSWWRDYVPNMHANDVWAPDINKYNGKWWLYYSVSEFGKNSSAIGLVSTDSIKEGEWKDEGLVVYSNSARTYNAIDPNLVIDKEGKPWLVFGSWFGGIQIVPLDKKTMKPIDLDRVKTIARREVNRSSVGLEGPIITFKDGYYYLFASVDHCCNGLKSDYKIAVGRGRKITGPYVDKNGINMLEGGATILDAGNSQYNGVGGQFVYNNELLVRHGYDSTASGMHFLLISNLKWDDEGWPTLGIGNFNGYYRIQNKMSRKYLKLAYNSTDDGAWTLLGEDTGHKSLEWQIYQKEEDYVRIQNRNSFKYLEVKEASNEAGAVIQQSRHENKNHQLWKLKKIDDQYYKIVNKKSGLLLEVAENSTGEESRIVQGVDKRADNQLWKLIWVKAEKN